MSRLRTLRLRYYHSIILGLRTPERNPISTMQWSSVRQLRHLSWSADLRPDRCVSLLNTLRMLVGRLRHYMRIVLDSTRPRQPAHNTSRRLNHLQTVTHHTNNLLYTTQPSIVDTVCRMPGTCLTRNTDDVVHWCHFRTTGYP